MAAACGAAWGVAAELLLAVSLVDLFGLRPAELGVLKVDEGNLFRLLLASAAPPCFD